MGKARISEVTAYFNSNIESVWNVVTDLKDYKWRSDIEKVEVLNDGKEFVEYIRGGNSTRFIITKKNKFREYKFDMENKMFNGFWEGDFSETENGGTKVVFKEKIFVKNPIIKILSYFFMDLKKIQNTYIADLKSKLGEQ
ncbi:MAG: SRPBCC family protein [Clostridiaceae bacterium]